MSATARVRGTQRVVAGRRFEHLSGVLGNEPLELVAREQCARAAARGLLDDDVRRHGGVRSEVRCCGWAPVSGATAGPCQLVGRSGYPMGARRCSIPWTARRPSARAIRMPASRMCGSLSLPSGVPVSSSLPRPFGLQRRTAAHPRRRGRRNTLARAGDPVAIIRRAFAAAIKILSHGWRTGHPQKRKAAVSRRAGSCTPTPPRTPVHWTACSAGWEGPVA